MGKEVKLLGGVYYDAKVGACVKCKAGEYLDPPSKACELDESKCVNAKTCRSCERQEDTYQVPKS